MIFKFLAQGAVRLKEFGEELRGVIMSIIPNNTPVHLILDGLSEETVDESLASYSGYHRIGPAPIEVRTEYFYRRSIDVAVRSCVAVAGLHLHKT